MKPVSRIAAKAFIRSSLLCLLLHAVSLSKIDRYIRRARTISQMKLRGSKHRAVKMLLYRHVQISFTFLFLRHQRYEKFGAVF